MGHHFNSLTNRHGTFARRFRSCPVQQRFDPHWPRPGSYEGNVQSKINDQGWLSYVKNMVETTPFHRIIFLSLYEKGILVEGLLYEIYFGLGTS